MMEIQKGKMQSLYRHHGWHRNAEDAMDCLVNEVSDYADTLQDFLDVYCSKEE